MWKDCYLKFSYLTADEAKEFANLNVNAEDPKEIQQIFDKSIEVLKDKFVEGEAIRENKKVSVTKEELPELPLEVLTKAVQMLVGNLDEGEKKEP